MIVRHRAMRRLNLDKCLVQGRWPRYRSSKSSQCVDRRTRKTLAGSNRRKGGLCLL